MFEFIPGRDENEVSSQSTDNRNDYSSSDNDRRDDQRDETPKSR